MIKEMIGNPAQTNCSDIVTETETDITRNLVRYASKIAGFKPIEHRDILRLKRMEDIEDEEVAKRMCLKEFWRCEMRIPTTVVEELLDDIVKVWNPSVPDWDKLYVEFKDERSVKVCFSYCKHMKNKESQILQFFPPEFRDQLKVLDSISYKLRKPEEPNGVKFKTRYRFGKFGLELEKRHPEQRSWTTANVHNLPPVDPNPVPQADPSDSPPHSRPRQRQSKRTRSPPSSPTSPESERTTKSSKKSKIPDDKQEKPSIENNSEFKALVDKFALN